MIDHRYRYPRYSGSRAQLRLLASLNRQQSETYLKLGYFDVVSNLGTPYRIDATGHISNVTNLAVNMRICCHIPCWDWNTGFLGDYPEEDHALAQALMLRTDELRFLAIARGVSYG